jgi:hypothetical protein
MKHENFRGALSYEVEETLRHWIMEHLLPADTLQARLCNT